MSPSPQPALDDILDAFVAAGIASLKAWIARYPEYEQELVEFAASWQLAEALPTSPEAHAVSDAQIAARGMAAARSRPAACA